MPSISRSQRYRRIVTVLMEEGFGTVLDQLGLKASWISKMRGTHDKAIDQLTPEFRARQTIERHKPIYARSSPQYNADGRLPDTRLTWPVLSYLLASSHFVV